MSCDLDPRYVSGFFRFFKFDLMLKVSLYIFYCLNTLYRPTHSKFIHASRSVCDNFTRFLCKLIN